MSITFDISIRLYNHFSNNVEQTFFPNPHTERGSSTKVGISSDGENITYGAGTNVIIRNIKVRLDVSCHFLESFSRFCLL